jgi:hypothetical protein
MLARLWVRMLVFLAGIIVAGIISILLGFNTPAPTIPVVGVIRQYPVGSLAIGAFLLFATLISLQIMRSAAQAPKNGQTDPDLGAGWRLPRLVISTAISTLSITLFAALLAVVLTRPAWCPTTLCPPPQLIPITNPQAVHDTNLEVYFTAVQSVYFTLPGDPSQYSPAHPPQDIAALRIDETQQPVYRVAVGVHSLQTGRFGVIIEQVALVVADLPATPQPLNVWLAGAPLDYHSNPYQIVYTGEAPGTTLSAIYVPFPAGHPQLSPGEADELDVQVISKNTLADLKFRVRVTYRVVNEADEHSLTLPQEFEVVFSDASNWHRYQQQGEHFVPSQP